MAVKCTKCNSDNTETSKFCSECGTKLFPADKMGVSQTKTIKRPKKDQLKGKTIVGRYKIIEKVGEGGMGVVYNAKDSRLDRSVALKFLPPELTSDEEAKKRFIQEAKAAAALNHPHICTIYEVDEADDQTFISMEYIKGQILKDKLEPGPLAIDEAKEIALQVAAGLEKAHKKGIVHRDIKPANIMINDEGQAKITDFGLAKLSWGVDLTKASTIMGTVAYMSPEQARGEEVDHRTDIWSLGAMFYEMLSGERPFKKSQEHALIYAILHDKPTPLSLLRSDVPSHLEQVVEKALAKNIDQRYQDIKELIQDLKQSSKLAVPKVKKSIAVLPFKNMSADPEQEYFCDGISEEIINALTQVKDLHVVARTSAFSFKGKDVDIREIGEKLNVENVLEGSVRKADDRLRITAQLISVADGYHIWSERYDRELADVFAIQDEVTQAIVDKLKIKLVGEEKAKLLKRHTENLEAYNLYLKALYFCSERTGEGMKKSMEYIQQAIENDPTYALAYSVLANSYSMLGFYGFLSPKDAFQKAKAAAQKALDLDDTLAEAHTSLGYVCLFYDWEWLSAEREYKRAIELNPGYATAHHWYAGYLAAMGRFDEAIAEMKQAQELDPLSIRLHTELGNYLRWSGRWNESIEHLLKTLEMDPNFGLAYVHIGISYALKERYEEAISAFQNATKLMGRSPRLISSLGSAYAMSGEKEKAEELLHKLKEHLKEGYVPQTCIANIYIGLGENDKAFEWFEKAYEERDPLMAFLKTWPEFENLRSDPRFNELLKKMGFL